jgi:ATP-dependent protease HslVU (ClpYQ) peptidase subunit
MNYATLLHGEPSEVMDILDHGDGDLTGLGMAMCNAFRRIDRLEKQLQRHRDALSKACGDDQDMVRDYLDSQG